MPSRTHHALGLGWATWIDLHGDNKGPVILTSSKNGTPHAYLEKAEDVERIFGVKRGAFADNLPSSETHRAFVQSFSDEALARIKVESEQYYADDFAKANEPADSSEAPTTRTSVDEAKPTRTRARKTGS